MPALRMLRERGLDVMAIIETMPATSDQAVLAVARKQERWLVIFDRDYGELVFSRQLPSPPAIVYLRQEPYPPNVPPPSWETRWPIRRVPRGISSS